MARRTLLISLAVVALLAPTMALAAPSWIPLVPCGSTGQPPCTPCYMFQAAKNFTDLILYGLTGPIAAFMFVLAGGMFLLGAGNVSMQQRARRLFTNTVLGVAIILVAWLGTDFLIKNIASGSTADNWYQFTCPDYLASIGAPVETVPPIAPARVLSLPSQVTSSTVSSDQMQQLAKAYNEKYPRQNAPDLVSLIQCIYRDPIIQALALPPPSLSGSGKQTTGIVTYDNDNESCNYTRGLALPGGSCSHTAYSCHYGGRTGSQGAEAVDMNARNAPVIIPGVTDSSNNPLVVQASEEALFCQLYNDLVVQHKCGDFGFINWEVGHTHISTRTCDGDGKGVSASSGRQAKLLDCANSARIPQSSSAPTSSTTP